MSILSQKKKVFGNIAAARTLTESMPKLKLNSSFPSINNDGNSITFLCDLIKTLIGYEALQQSITDTLVYELKNIELEVKQALKSELKSIVNCGVNPSIPDIIKPDGNGMSYIVDKVDFTGIMFIDPYSSTGKLLYNDLTPNLINSSDYNTFLYQTIQNDGTVEAWPQTTTATNKILSFQFKSNDISRKTPNNTITVKAHSDYSNKTLTDLNNDYIDSISLFNTEKLLSNIIDMVFGTISNASNKTIKQLENEAKINTVIDKIINSDNNDIINDKYFVFSNSEKNQQEIDAKNRKEGKKILNTSNQLSTSVSLYSITEMNDSVSSTTNQIQKKDAVSNSLNLIGNEVAAYSNNSTDHQSLKFNFIQELINNLIKSIVNTILSPKVISIFIINFKIIYGPDATFTDAVDFLKKNKNLIHNITKRITELIIKTLLNILLKQLLNNKLIKINLT